MNCLACLGFEAPVWWVDFCLLASIFKTGLALYATYSLEYNGIDEVSYSSLSAYIELLCGNSTVSTNVESVEVMRTELS